MEEEVDGINAVAVSDLEQLMCPFTGNNCTKECSLFTSRGCSLNYLSELLNINRQLSQMNRETR